MQPIDNYENTDVQNSTSIYCQSISNINDDNKSETSPSSKNKDQNIINNQVNKYECNICKRMFPKRTLIIKHFRTSLCFPKITYDCENNNYNYYQYNNFENSISYINHINDTKEAYKCNICKTVIQNKLIKNCQILNIKKNNLKYDTCSKVNGIANENTDCPKEKFTWKCKKCREIFKVIKVHSENKLFDCNICDKSYIHFDTLIKHKKTHKEFFGANNRILNLKNGTKIKYLQRDVNFKSNISKNNSRIYNTSQSYECSTCSKVFHKRFKLITHIFTSHQENYSKRSCDPCSNRCDSSQEFIFHVKKNFFKCDVCPRSFTTSHRLHQHYSWHLGINYFKCQFCPKTFSKCSVYLLHERIHTREKPFRCNFCDKWFPGSSNLNIHLGFNDPFICNTCEKPFFQISSFISHKKIHLLKNQMKNKKIKKSYYQSTSERYLRQHTGRKTFKCKVCNKSFIQSSTLSAHSKTHTKKYLNKFDVHNKILTRSSLNNKKIFENKCFKCDLCKEIFSDWNIFTVHKCTSKKCKLCEKVLSNTFSLKRHYMNIHQNKKPFQKNENKQKERNIQTQNVSLKLNMNNSANELEENDMNKEYKCDLCTKIFHKQCQIYNHILETHY